MNQADLQEIRNDAYAKTLYNRYTAFLQVQQKLVWMMGEKWKQCNEGTPNKFKEADKELIREMKKILECSEEIIRKQQEDIKNCLDNRKKLLEMLEVERAFAMRCLRDNYNYKLEEEIKLYDNLTSTLKGEKARKIAKDLKEVLVAQHRLQMLHKDDSDLITYLQ